MRLVAACAQFTPEKARVEANLDRLAELILQASGEGVDLIAFPETATTAYFLEGGVAECALTREALLDGLTKRLGALARLIDVVVGFYEKANTTYYNSAAYLELGASPRCVHVYRKFFLPTYGVFDEERFVSRGRELGIAQTRFGPVGMLICEDVWHSILGTLLALNGARIVIVPSASPARGFQGELPGNVERYEAMLKSLSREHGVFCLNPMLAGFEGGKGFVGGSMITNPAGELINRSPLLEDHLLVSELDLDLVDIARDQLPLLSDLQSAWPTIRAIIDRID